MYRYAHPTGMYEQAHKEGRGGSETCPWWRAFVKNSALVLVSVQQCQCPCHFDIIWTNRKHKRPNRYGCTGKYELLFGVSAKNSNLHVSPASTTEIFATHESQQYFAPGIMVVLIPFTIEYRAIILVALLKYRYRYNRWYRQWMSVMQLYRYKKKHPG